MQAPVVITDDDHWSRLPPRQDRRRSAPNWRTSSSPRRLADGHPGRRGPPPRLAGPPPHHRARRRHHVNQLVYFSSVSGNTAPLRREARPADADADPALPERPPLHARDEPYVLVLPTYGGGDGEAPSRSRSSGSSTTRATAAHPRRDRGGQHQLRRGATAWPATSSPQSATSPFSTVRTLRDPGRRLSGHTQDWKHFGRSS